MTLVQITAPHLCAGIVVRDDVVAEAAPILAWTIGKRRDWLRGYFRDKGWTAVVVPHCA